MEKQIIMFLATQKLAVISTVDPKTAAPESALIAFAEDDDLNLYFQTARHTRKAGNLRVNPRVSLVIGLTQQDGITVQYEGRAEQITVKGEIEACKQRFLAKDSPATAEYFDHPSAIFFKVTPVWIGYSDYRGERAVVDELVL